MNGVHRDGAGACQLTTTEFVDLYLNAAGRARSELVPVYERFDLDVQAEALKNYRLASLDKLWDWSGCSPSQIEEVRAFWGGWLPESYEAYLRLMGIRSRHVDVGVGCGYPAVLEADGAYGDWRSETAQLQPEWSLDEDRFWVPEDARHLGHHEGYVFFFVADRVADPIVHQLLEGSGDGSGVSTTGSTISQLVVRGITGARDLAEKKLLNVARRRDARTT